MTLGATALGYRIGHSQLLEGVDLDIQPGRMTAVLGPNGAGKSTLLRLLAGEMAPDSGTIHLNGRRYQHWSREEVARQVAVLPQSSSLGFAFTALEVVLMGRIPHASGHTRDLEIAQACLQETDCWHLRHRPFPVLSGGEQQRIQLARVLAQLQDQTDNHPRYLLLDEPTAALDPAHQLLTLQLARRRADQGMGVLVILHDLNLAARFADRVLLLQQGHPLALGPTDEVLTPDRLSGLYQLPMQVIDHPNGQGKLVVSL
ncbi:heme ABC transporter ATP-binding protein [Marinobacterium marinum]|uniref:Heme ABC transporter ATP-binding protein n=1 Tax=Marinobacterium marinum TaxID=2756129 RepID=A0A7W2ACT0_9GAMM|nr:heme ABC transporter ATP-binding protein [Marinobacterium marinum]MBA4503430.1 heme ABC transporter ATP-binding protein [Marinobacterium marinum]